ncbi:hypothetical protein J1N35_022526 [Gossypium stocksii]|uniref:Uncharacterized protein n=1 Tax=Gossypium stocksii TaxID=47602 RepID=A0A9D4A318_9ROSI|nr:hypothetical protein J1N35_022526 [Gossypium stocksii]
MIRKTLYNLEFTSSPEKPAHGENKEDSEDLHENPQETKIEPELENESERVAKLEDEPIKEPTLTKIPFPSRLEEKK